MLAAEVRGPMTKRNRTKRMPVRREERCPPTPETVAKRVPDSLAFLPEEYQRAAGHIEAAYRIAIALVSGKISRPGTVGGGKHVMTDAEAEQVRIYILWLDELKRRKIPHYPMLNIIVDGALTWFVDQRRRWQPGTAGELLIEALDIYCRLDKTPPK